MTYRPVLILGNGIRQNPDLIKHLCGLNIPVLLTWPALDYLDENDPVFCGRLGFWFTSGKYHSAKGDASILFWCALGWGAVSYDYENFAPNASILVAI